MYDEAGLGYLCHGAFMYLSGGERYLGEARHCHALTGREQGRTVDGLVKAREARRLLATGHLTVATDTGVVASVAVQGQVQHLSYKFTIS